ncbi:hypothetical protein [Luteibacter rhizovicinus]|uniref:hypothetical protein n=1 Tax=Luteibacter rhizovicinus TaxID=242606 RepID=UPI00069F11A7|nr:hypothetical protein [Luteibacter rhizovicinus]
MNEEASAIVVDLARDLIGAARSLDADWKKAYYRFQAEELHQGASASYVSKTGVTIIGAITSGSFFDSMDDRSSRLMALLGKQKGVFLLSADESFDYKIQFEWDDLRRWEITKMDGRSGIPEGM